MKPKFQTARNNPKMRQSFLNAVDLEDKAKYIEKVRYREPVSWLHGGRMVMNTHPHDHIYNGKRFLPSIVDIYPMAFDDPSVFETEQDFLSVLVDHEGRHAWQWWNAPKRWLAPKFSRDIQAATWELYSVALDHYDDHETASELVEMKVKWNWYNAEREIDAFEHQFSRIDSGRRQVSDNMYKNITEKLRFFASFCEWARGNISNGQFIEMVDESKQSVG